MLNKVVESELHYKFMKHYLDFDKIRKFLIFDEMEIGPRTHVLK